MEPLLRRLEPRGSLLARSLPGEIRTAYPRRSKLFRDPPRGLATVEALVSALAILGSPDFSLLEGYLWADNFLALNRDFFQGLEGEGGSSGGFSGLEYFQHART